MSEILDILKGHARLWQSLRKRDVFVTTSRGGERAFHRRGDRAAESGCLSNAKALKAVCAALQTAPPAGACVIDAVQACALVKEQGLGAADAIMRARVRYQGTDGVRGKVADDDDATTPLAKLTERGEFTPGLCELLSAAVLLAGNWDEPPAVVVAEDGRDAFGERRYAATVIETFRRFGCKVFDLGICPTPVAPVAAATLGARIAAVVTASHNPADQNGVKFFIDGRKPLPETGDYPMSAYAFQVALEGLPKRRKAPRLEKVEAGPFLRAILDAALTDADRDALKRVTLILDVAHGSFAPFVADALADLDIEIMNADMTGENINRDSGVAYIEGKDRIAGADVAGEIAIVARVRERAIWSDRLVIGLAFDADGDRGFVLVHDVRADEVRIIDGDRIAYMVAKLAHDAGAVDGRVFAGTVESDLAVFDAVRALGIETVLTPVGDKWLSSRRSLTDRLLVGEEPSGHVVIPIDMATANGREQIVTGNGLVTGLLGAAAMVRLRLSPAEAAEPYPPGVFCTHYCYFVDRARLYRDSRVWRTDLQTAHMTLKGLKTTGDFDAEWELREIGFDDDPDMLYLQLVEGERVLGAIFTRNSGTENRSAVYARGLSAFERPMRTLAHHINGRHMMAMKDRRLVETKAGDALADAVLVRERMSLDDARTFVRQLGITTDVQFHALLFALQREGRVKRIGDEIAVVETERR